MSNAASSKTKRKDRGLLLALLEKLGVLDHEQVEEVERIQKRTPGAATEDILISKGYASKHSIKRAVRAVERSEFGEHTQKARRGADVTITTSLRLSDVAEAIAAKKCKGGPK